MLQDDLHPEGSQDDLSEEWRELESGRHQICEFCLQYPVKKEPVALLIMVIHRGKGEIKSSQACLQHNGRTGLGACLAHPLQRRMQCTSVDAVEVQQVI